MKSHHSLTKVKRAYHHGYNSTPDAPRWVSGHTHGVKGSSLAHMVGGKTKPVLDKDEQAQESIWFILPFHRQANGFACSSAYLSSKELSGSLGNLQSFLFHCKSGTTTMCLAGG